MAVGFLEIFRYSIAECSRHLSLTNRRILLIDKPCREGEQKGRFNLRVKGRKDGRRFQIILGEWYRTTTKKAI